MIFYTLYGHLAASSLNALHIGKTIKEGAVFATIGDVNENGGWASHLHFQIIRDMGEYLNDYPGVVDPNEADFYLKNCPNPNWILGRDDLG
ncbi:peptidoglycan DD-metalloendopeptidase family protein [Vibrio rumoiensis]|uniref:Peptidase M23 domain-containing protein n=1 Tax=Vibrio rumoiensis 1S-45 TaxID=1188252 RepID=A0A1E5E4X6_9VIBR|nr:peptidoglycan DD-metalloendopeptidase family protein [Vibrio rumoiensis]OEF28179.1 hypothetical protein A1QC_05935 [Vibrio rumoiensis 1S-45]